MQSYCDWNIFFRVLCCVPNTSRLLTVSVQSWLETTSRTGANKISNHPKKYFCHKKNFPFDTFFFSLLSGALENSAKLQRNETKKRNCAIAQTSPVQSQCNELILLDNFLAESKSAQTWNSVSTSARSSRTTSAALAIRCYRLASPRRIVAVRCKYCLRQIFIHSRPNLKALKFDWWAIDSGVGRKLLFAFCQKKSSARAI